MRQEAPLGSYHPPLSPARGGNERLKRRRRARTDKRLTPILRAGRGRKGSGGRLAVFAGVVLGGLTAESFCFLGSVSCL